MATSHVAIAGGARLWTRVDAGPGADAPWIVLSNGLATDLSMWDPQIPLLSTRYRVLRYDTRGHGASDAPTGPYTFEDLVADAVAVMDHHGIARATFMGLSLGGMTALGLGLTHPERCERLVVCDARADAPEAFVASWADRVAMVTSGGLAAVVPGNLERWYAASFRAAHPEALRDAETMILRTSVAGYTGCAGALKGLDYLRRLPQLTVPTLYVVGAEDTGVPPAVMQAMADATPGGRLAVVPNAAHVANVDNTAGFNAAIADFLGLG